MYRKKDRKLQKENVTVSLEELVPESSEFVQLEVNVAYRLSSIRSLNLCHIFRHSQFSSILRT